MITAADYIRINSVLFNNKDVAHWHTSKGLITIGGPVNLASYILAGIMHPDGDDGFDNYVSSLKQFVDCINPFHAKWENDPFLINAEGHELLKEYVLKRVSLNPLTAWQIADGIIKRCSCSKLEHMPEYWYILSMDTLEAASSIALTHINQSTL